MAAGHGPYGSAEHQLAGQRDQVAPCGCKRFSHDQCLVIGDETRQAIQVTPQASARNYRCRGESSMGAVAKVTSRIVESEASKGFCNAL